MTTSSATLPATIHRYGRWVGRPAPTGAGKAPERGSGSGCAAVATVLGAGREAGGTEKRGTTVGASVEAASRPPAHNSQMAPAREAPQRIQIALTTLPFLRQQVSRNCELRWASRIEPAPRPISGMQTGAGFAEARQGGRPRALTRSDPGCLASASSERCEPASRRPPRRPASPWARAGLQLPEGLLPDVRGTVEPPWVSTS